jgi:hypothetical protein
MPFDDATPAVVTDFYANTNDDVQPLGVLHIGTGSPIAMVLIANQPGDSNTTAFVGPAFSYFESLQSGMPLVRFQDEDWRKILSQSNVKFEHLHRNLNAALARRQQYLAGMPDGEAGLTNEYLDNQIRILEQQIQQKFALAPEWTHSFRLPSSDPVKIHLPSAQEILVASASERLHPLLMPMYLVGAGEQFKNEYSWNEFGLKTLVNIVLHRAESLLVVDGVDEQLIAELTELLQQLGHLGQGD